MTKYKKVYLYDDKSFYLDEMQVMLDPLESEKQGKEIYLIPTNATTLKPERIEKYIPQWTGENWQQVENHKGEYYYPAGSTYYSSPIEMKEYGPFPEGSTTTRPERTIEELREWKIQQIDLALSQNDAKAMRCILNNESSNIDSINAAQSENRRLRALVATLENKEEIEAIEAIVWQFVQTE